MVVGSELLSQCLWLLEPLCWWELLRQLLEPLCW